MPARRSITNKEDWGDSPALFETSVEIFRYLVVIGASEEMIAEVAHMKRMVAEHIGSFRGDRAIAHMTLMYMYVPIEYERDMLAAIESAAKDHVSFTVEFRNIHLLPDNSTIYIDPLQKDPIIALRKDIKKHLQSLRGLKKLGVHVTSMPMITIARKLKPQQAAMAMEILRPHEYHRSELVDEVILLRGSQKEGGKYEVTGRIGLP